MPTPPRRSEAELEMIARRLKEGFQAMEVGNFDEWFEKTYRTRARNLT
jgi:hypothetical protein